MESLASVHSYHQPFHRYVNHLRPLTHKPIPFVSFGVGGPIQSSSPSSRSLSIRVSSTSSSSSLTSSPYQNPKPSLQPLSSILNATFASMTAAAAIFFMRLQLKPAIAAPVVTSPLSATAGSTKELNDEVPLEEQERALEQHVARHPKDVDALRSLMEVRIKSRKLLEAIEVIDRLIGLEPDEKEWPLLKSQIYSYSGDLDAAKSGFEEILAKDPLRVEAYHGLVMSYSDSGQDLKGLEDRIKDAMEKCKKEKNSKDLRDFKLLIAQIRVIEGKHNEALKVYEELVKEEPRDFRPYLCQGIIYTLLKKKDEAEKQFEKFRRLVPRNHPYREYFVDNMVATKLFAEKTEREMAGSKN